MNFRLTILLLTFVTIFTSACKKGDKTKNENDKQTITVTTDENTQPEPSTASGNFEANDYFESFIAKNTDSESIVNLNKPKMNGELLRKENKLQLEVNGYWINDSKKSSITLEVYPNSFEEGNDNRPIIEQKLKLTRENKFLLFSYLNTIALDEGLYYFFLKDNSNPIYTGKFLVKE